MPASVKRAGLLAGLAIVAALFPRGAAAQSTISGLVTDPSGAVLPGVAVEASGAALTDPIQQRGDGRAFARRHDALVLQKSARAV